MAVDTEYRMFEQTKQDRQVLLTTLPYDSLLHDIRSLIKEEIRSKQLEEIQEKLCTPAETCRILNISKPTLIKWEKESRLKMYRMGGRCYFKYKEIMESLTSLKRYQRPVV